MFILWEYIEKIYNRKTSSRTQEHQKVQDDKITEELQQRAILFSLNLLSEESFLQKILDSVESFNFFDTKKNIIDPLLQTLNLEDIIHLCNTILSAEILQKIVEHPGDINMLFREDTIGQSLIGGAWAADEPTVQFSFTFLNPILGPLLKESTSHFLKECQKYKKDSEVEKEFIRTLDTTKRFNERAKKIVEEAYYKKLGILGQNISHVTPVMLGGISSMHTALSAVQGQLSLHYDITPEISIQFSEGEVANFPPGKQYTISELYVYIMGLFLNIRLLRTFMSLYFKLFFNDITKNYEDLFGEENLKKSLSIYLSTTDKTKLDARFIEKLEKLTADKSFKQHFDELINDPAMLQPMMELLADSANKDEAENDYEFIHYALFKLHQNYIRNNKDAFINYLRKIITKIMEQPITETCCEAILEFRKEKLERPVPQNPTTSLENLLLELQNSVKTTHKIPIFHQLYSKISIVHPSKKNVGKKFSIYLSMDGLKETFPATKTQDYEKIYRKALSSGLNTMAGEITKKLKKELKEQDPKNKLLEINASLMELLPSVVLLSGNAGSKKQIRKIGKHIQEIIHFLFSLTAKPSNLLDQDEFFTSLSYLAYLIIVIDDSHSPRKIDIKINNKKKKIYAITAIYNLASQTDQQRFDRAISLIDPTPQELVKRLSKEYLLAWMQPNVIPRARSWDGGKASFWRTNSQETEVYSDKEDSSSPSNLSREISMRKPNFFMQVDNNKCGQIDFNFGSMQLKSNESEAVLLKGKLYTPLKPGTINPHLSATQEKCLDLLNEYGIVGEGAHKITEDKLKAWRLESVFTTALAQLAPDNSVTAGLFFTFLFLFDDRIDRSSKLDTNHVQQVVNIFKNIMNNRYNSFSEIPTLEFPLFECFCHMLLKVASYLNKNAKEFSSDYFLEELDNYFNSIIQEIKQRTSEKVIGEEIYEKNRKHTGAVLLSFELIMRLKGINISEKTRKSLVFKSMRETANIALLHANDIVSCVKEQEEDGHENLFTVFYQKYKDSPPSGDEEIGQYAFNKVVEQHNIKILEFLKMQRISKQDNSIDQEEYQAYYSMAEVTLWDNIHWSLAITKRYILAPSWNYIEIEMPRDPKIENQDIDYSRGDSLVV